jgi:hypothetical protein
MVALNVEVEVDGFEYGGTIWIAKLFRFEPVRMTSGLKG